MIYLDNAATSFPKPESVIRATTECIRSFCGNPGRSSHKLSMKTSEKIYDTRIAVAELLGISAPERVVFTSGATAALNLAIKTTVAANSHVIISDIEHNSVLRPIHKLTKTHGVSYSVFDTNGNIEKNIEKLISEKTTCLISTLKSNVTGFEVPLDRLSAVAKKHSLKLIVDASQMIGHKKINLENAPCDILAAPSHKGLFGIQGAGFLVFLDDLSRDSFFEGGSGSESKSLDMPENLPERFEAGTLPSPAIVSLLSGIKYINKIGIEEITEKLEALTARYTEILYGIKKCVLYAANDGILSFNLLGASAEAVAHELDKAGIFVRGGLHCAPLAHKKLGTLDIGTVRISLSYLNSIKECDKVYRVLSKI